MKKVVLWNKGIEKQLKQASENALDYFLELVRYIQSEKIPDLICAETLASEELWNWIGKKDDIELNDIKRELSRKLEKARYTGSKEFEERLQKVGKAGPVKTLVFSFGRECIFYIADMEGYYAGLRGYLVMEKKNDFCSDLQECFPHIYFSEGVEASVNTLNRKFEDIREEIAKHLSRIDQYQERFLKLSDAHCSFREIAQEFKQDTGIDCSPQAGREGVKRLRENCFNTIMGQEEMVTCELHTKFDKFNINREEQDRIYFFPGKRGIREGRSIVKYIGTHL